MDDYKKPYISFKFDKNIKVLSKASTFDLSYKNIKKGYKKKSKGREEWKTSNMWSRHFGFC